MYKYKISNQAQQDLINIWNYTFETWSEDQADKYYKALISGFDIICYNPFLLGKNYNSIIKELKGFKVKKRIIFYLIFSSSEIFIVRILHENMDFKRHLRFSKR